MADFRHAEKVLAKIDRTEVKSSLNIVLPGNLMLGELQDSYTRCCNHRENYRDYLAENYLPEKIELLRRQMQKQREHFMLSLKQQKMMEQELEISKKGLERHQSLLDKGGVSESLKLCIILYSNGRLTTEFIIFVDTYKKLDIIKMKSISKELVGASAIPIILSVLENGDTYGYEILQRIKKYTDGEVTWQEASIYPLLKKMENNGLIKSYWKMGEKERPRKYYKLLSDGKEQLEYNKQEWQRLNGVFENLWNPA